MNLAKIGVVAGAAALAAMLWTMQDTGVAAPAARPAPGEFAIRDVRVFDGETFVPRTTVLVRDGLIAAVGPDLELPAGIDVVEGRGRTLLPGLIDGHVHTWADARRDALRFGVTTVLDMFSDHRQLAAARSEREDLAQSARADLWSAGTLATVDGGHGTQFGVAVPTVAAATDAPAWVAARQAEGSDFIKIVREDLHVYDAGRSLPTLDAVTAAALIDAAHGRGMLAVVHASAQDSARESLRDGADGLVHVFQDAPADPEFVALARTRGAFVVPTLSVIAAFSGRPSALAEDPRLRGWLAPEQLQSLGESMRFAQPTPALLANAIESVRRLHAAGVVILAGTDAPNPGTAHGASLHGELQLLAEAGLTPAQALAAATSAPAKAFGLADRGRIAPGLRADLLLVEGDPGQDLAATRAIVTVWKNGRPVDRRVVAAETPVLMAGAISHFDNERIDSRLGSGWIETSDRMAGGNSDAKIARIGGGAGGTAGALQVTGTVRAGSEQRWAGAFLNPGDQMMQALDGSGLRELSFHIRGDGRPVAVLLFTGAQGSRPQVRMVDTASEWRAVRLPLAEFAGADLARLRAIAITTEVEGEFVFELDQVEIR
jgi:imidazolonepropionase-like amidohydrolase